MSSARAFGSGPCWRTLYRDSVHFHGVRVPVTARLSKLFYDRLGEEIANELVDWFNRVDTTSRADLREFNELNFARFDAKLEQRTAELRSDLTTFEARLNRRVDSVESRIDSLEARLNAKIGTLASKEWMEKSLKEQTRWFVLAWAVLIASNIGLWFR